MGFGYLTDLADALLEAARAGLDEQARGAPTARLALFDPAWDNCCPEDESSGEGGGQLTVYLDGVTFVPASRDRDGRSRQCQAYPVATFNVDVVRCVPSLLDSPTAPFHEADVYGAAAEALLEDLWAMIREVLDRFYAGTLFPDLGVDCSGVVLGDVEPLPETGGCAGWRWSIEVTCNDTEPVAS